MNVSSHSEWESLQHVWNHPVVFGYRSMFYVITPQETTYENYEDVPHFVNKSIPFFATLVVLEMIVQRLVKGSKPTRVNDATASISAGIMSLLPELLLKSGKISSYVFAHKFRLWDIPDDNLSWCAALVGVDFGYYWAHRMMHEVNFMWSAHQVHHSSEDYNLTTALRQSVYQKYGMLVFYLPLALLGISPQLFLVHLHFNLVYQFWIHTEVVGKLGPLEYIMNTASHHRVHHGRNRYCIDKNYGGTLIIWDRMFGTFAEEDEEVVYGLTHNLNSWEAFNIQFCHLKHILKRTWSRKGIWNKISTWIKGPGWAPGKPRMGRPQDIPDVHAPVVRYDGPPVVPTWYPVYAMAHLSLVLFAYHLMANHDIFANPLVTLSCIGLLMWTLTDIGYIYENRWYAGYLEIARCLTVLLLDILVIGAQTEGALLSRNADSWLYIPRSMFIFSLSTWALHFVTKTADSHVD